MKFVAVPINTMMTVFGTNFTKNIREKHMNYIAAIVRAINTMNFIFLVKSTIKIATL